MLTTSRAPLEQLETWLRTNGERWVLDPASVGAVPNPNGVWSTVLPITGATQDYADSPIWGFSGCLPKVYTDMFPLSQDGVNLITQVSNSIESLETCVTNVTDRLAAAVYLRKCLFDFFEGLALTCLSPTLRDVAQMETVLAAKIAQIGGDTSVSSSAAPRLPLGSPTLISRTFAQLRANQFAEC